MFAVSTGYKFHKSWCASSRFSLHCFFWTFLLLSFFLPVVDDDFFWGGRMAKTLGRITKFIKSHEEDHFSKTSFKGRGPKNHLSSLRPPPPLLQATLFNDWSLTETFPRSMIMINKSLPQEPISPHFLWVYQRNNLRGMLGEHHVQAFLISCSPNIPNIIKWILSPVNR